MVTGSMAIPTGMVTTQAGMGTEIGSTAISTPTRMIFRYYKYYKNGRLDMGRTALSILYNFIALAIAGLIMCSLAECCHFQLRP